MPSSQSGICPEANRHAIFITLMLNEGQDNAAVVRQLSASLPALTSEVALLDEDAALTSVVAFGSDCWERLFNAKRPAGLRPFPAMDEDSRRAPATSADLFLHIRSERHDLNFRLARELMHRFGHSVSLVEEIRGFSYLDSRDLTGFVDGTENPQGEERADVALVGAEEPEFSGGSYVSIQRYVHNLEAWECLTVPQQEQVIGRTKVEDIELRGEAKPATAHISRVVIQENGEELEVLRLSMPYGTLSEAGLYFVAYARSADNFEKMLSRMIHKDTSGHYDHLMNYTRPVTGAAFFAPSLDFLQSLA